jgi:hypothetical protein
MATTTTNFGWDIPQSTDLVKDGATAIAALGQDIDTALVDLKGGTTGQVLSKASNTDMDFTWVTDAAGDITGVTAGTGISGGGTSGTVTVTNSMATAIDAKGDLVAGTGADAFARLGVGTNGQVLTADSTAATGLAWATAASGTTFVGCSVKRTANKTLSNNTETKIDFDAENFDTNGFHDNTTNNTRLTVPTGQGGYYLVTWNAIFAGNNTGYRSACILKNGAAAPGSAANAMGGISSYSHAGNQFVINLVAGDYIEVSAFQNSGVGLTLFCEPEFPNATVLTLSRLGS